MATPPTLVNAQAVGGAVTGNQTTAAFTTTTGDVVTIIGIDEGGVVSCSPTAPTTTWANGGVTNLQLINSGSPAARCGIRADTFTVSTGASGTVSQSDTDAANVRHVLYQWVHRGATAAVAGRSASATGSSRVLSYTPSQVDSALCWGTGDWSASAVQTQTPTPTTHTSASPGPTAMPNSGTSTNQFTWYGAVLDDQTSVAAVSYGIGGTGTGPFTIAVVEVQGTGAAVARPRLPRVVRQAVTRASVI